MGHEDNEQPIGFTGDEPGASVGKVNQAAVVTRLDGQLGCLHWSEPSPARRPGHGPPILTTLPYGKRLRRASRTRDGRPPAGADSKRWISPFSRFLAPQ